LEEYSALSFRVKQSKMGYIDNHLPLDLGQCDLKKERFYYCKGYDVVLCTGGCFEVYHIYNLEGTIIPNGSYFMSVLSV
jgi:hypothetical protein